MNSQTLIIWFLTMNTILIYFSIYFVLYWLKYFKVNVRQMTFLPPNIYVCLFLKKWHFLHKDKVVIISKKIYNNALSFSNTLFIYKILQWSPKPLLSN